MKYLVTAHHGLERYCVECKALRIVLIGEDEQRGERLTVCTRCQTTISHEPISVPFTTRETPEVVEQPLTLAEGEVRWDVHANPADTFAKVFQR